MTVTDGLVKPELIIDPPRRAQSSWDLLHLLIKKELTVRYQKNVLGYFWSVGNPLSFALVYHFAFKVVMQIDIDAYPLVVVSGLFPWQWYSSGVSSGPNAFISAAALLKKVNFPRFIIPLATNLNHMIHFIFTLPVLLLLVLAYRSPIHAAWIYGFPIQVAIQFATLFGISLTLASLNLFLRDIERLIQIIVRLLFYFTPIIYTTELVPDRYLKLIAFNPAAPIMINWRELVLRGDLNWSYVLISLAYAVFFLITGCLIYRKLYHRFAEVI